MKRVMVGLAFVVMASGAAAQDASPPFAVGQVWTLQDAPAGTRFTIMQIDVVDGRTLVHGSPSGFPAIVTPHGVVVINGVHMPFAEEAVRRSVRALERSGSPVTKAFREGYAQWEAAQGGYFTITVSEAIEVSKEVILTGQPSGQ